jgi:hypothetical protein
MSCHWGGHGRWSECRSLQWLMSVGTSFRFPLPRTLRPRAVRCTSACRLASTHCPAPSVFAPHARWRRFRYLRRRRCTSCSRGECRPAPAAARQPLLRLRGTSQCRRCCWPKTTVTSPPPVLKPPYRATGRCHGGTNCQMRAARWHLRQCIPQRFGWDKIRMDCPHPSRAGMHRSPARRYRYRSCPRSRGYPGSQTNKRSCARRGGG